MLNKIIISILPIFPKSFVKIFAKKYVAGDTISDAVRVVKELNLKNILATMDVLGEDVSSKEEAFAALKECKEVLDTIKKFNLNSNLSLKLTQLGLKIDKQFCYENVKEVVSLAKSYNNFVRIDMEDSPFTTDTIEIFSRLRKEFTNVGIVIQAYLKRSKKDIEELIKIGATFRLCKGIYVEPADIAYKGHDEVNQNYLNLLEIIFISRNHIGIATHDNFLVDNAQSLIKKYNLQKNEYEFQMLLGVKPDLRDSLIAKGCTVRIYVPYGVHWYKYSVRRLKENPKMAGYIIKSLFVRG